MNWESETMVESSQPNQPLHKTTADDDLWAGSSATSSYDLLKPDSQRPFDHDMTDIGLLHNQLDQHKHAPSLLIHKTYYAHG